MSVAILNGSPDTAFIPASRQGSLDFRNDLLTIYRGIPHPMRIVGWGWIAGRALARQFLTFDVLLYRFYRATVTYRDCTVAVRPKAISPKKRRDSFCMFSTNGLLVAVLMRLTRSETANRGGIEIKMWIWSASPENSRIRISSLSRIRCKTSCIVSSMVWVIAFLR